MKGLEAQRERVKDRREYLVGPDRGVLLAQLARMALSAKGEVFRARRRAPKMHWGRSPRSPPCLVFRPSSLPPARSLESASRWPAGGGADDAGVEIDNGFESDDPSRRRSANEERRRLVVGRGVGGRRCRRSGGSADSAGRVVQEADIIKVDGDRLYALSKFGGLAVVDIANPDHLELLGRKRIDGMPFEMYVANGRAFVMLNDFGRWVASEGNCRALGAIERDPRARRRQCCRDHRVSRFDVPGTIADSRMVGDAVCVVTYENGYCWGCGTTPATIVATSFKASGARS